MNIKKRAFKMVFIFMAVSNLSITALAGEWVDGYKDPMTQYEVNDGYKYDDGTIVKNSWRWIDDNSDGIFECYFFKQYGSKAKGEWPDGGDYVNIEGKYAPGLNVQYWKPTENELLDIWDGLHVDMGDSTTTVSSYYIVSDMDENGFTLTYKHQSKEYPHPYEEDVYKMKWLEGKTAAVYSEYESGKLTDYMELSIDPFFGLDATYYTNIDNLSIVRRDLDDADNLIISEDGKIEGVR